MNKPVAWMLVDKNWNDFCRYSSYPTKGAIPLYTHPLKELTDEEIKAIAIQYIEMRLDGDRFGYFDFARAILKKASEG